MALLKRKGKLLQSDYDGGLNDFPPEFLAQVGTHKTVQQVPLDITTDAIVGLLIESKVEEEFTDERKKTNTFLTDFPGPLTAEVKLPSGLVGTLTRTLVPVPTALLVDGLTEEASQHNLGNGWLDQNITEAPSLFTRRVYSRERPSVTPQDFAALLQTHGFAETEDGDAADPGVLPDGYVSVTDSQLDVFHHRLDSRFIDINDLPDQITNYKTNQFKQQVVAARELRVDDNSPPMPTALADTRYTVLGDGTALVEVDVVDEVFDNRSASTELPDLLPDIFKALLQSHSLEFTEDGDTIDDTPNLSTGDFFRSETRETEYTRRIRTRGRAGISYPQDIVASREYGGIEFGGETLKTTGYLNTSEPSVETGLGVLTSQVLNLGNGTFFRQTQKWDTATEWPTLIGTEVDPRTGIVVGIEKKTVDAGTEGGVFGDDYVDVKPYDKYKSIQITSRLDPDSLPAPVTWETTVEHRFPNTLFGVEWIWAAASGTLAYDFDMALVLDMDEGYAGPCRARVTESYSNGPPSDTVSPTIFCPKAHMVGFAWAFAADTTTECDSCTDIARAHAQTWSIPSSLHDEIEIGGAVTLDHGSFTSTLPATIPIGLPTPGSLITKECNVERWRFHVFYRRLVEIYVPDCSAE